MKRMFLHPVLALIVLAGCQRDEDPQTAYNQQPGYQQGGYQQGGYQQPGGGYQQPGGGYQQPGGGSAPGQYTPPAGGGTAPPPAGGVQPGAFPFPIPGFPLPGGQPQGGGTQPPPAGGGTAPAPGGFPWPFPAPGGGGGGASGGGSATPLDPTLASAATVPLMAVGAQEAPGMQKEGPTIAGQFKAGQSLEATTQLLPNKCYTIVAVGAGIQELDISLVALTPVPGASPELARDNTTGANATLGGKGQCFKWQAPFGINAKWVLTAKSGEGMAAGQLYVK